MQRCDTRILRKNFFVDSSYNSSSPSQFMRFQGNVQHGLHKGKQFGFPTVNFDINCAPEGLEHGIYAVRARILASEFEGQEFGGMMHYGPRPAVHAEASLEVHLFDFDRDIYGKEVEVEIVGERIREVMDFDTLEGLVEQLADDECKARKILG